MASDAFVDQPFKNREHVLAEIRLCVLASGVCQLLSFPFGDGYFSPYSHYLLIFPHISSVY